MLDIVGGLSVGTCLGDLFSVNWMENTEIIIQQKKLCKDNLRK